MKNITIVKHLKFKHFKKMNIIILIITTFISIITATNPPTVDIPSLGKIEGGFQKSLNERQFYAFEGIPYARPPVGDRRFKEPVPPKPWSDTWKAKTVYKCMQLYHYTPAGEDPVVGDEDCLYLNIYTTKLNKNANLDVIVYIHGGAFMFLHGAFYKPNYIMDRDVVFINFNYRLGPLGFLSTEDDTVPGNNGIKDQTLALKWVKDNVKYFGGNPDSVTIFGMSAGGASVHTHYLTPHSRGLFHRGMSQSGTTLNPWVLMEAPLEKSKRLAFSLGCSTKEVRKMVDCLRKRPGRQIVAAVKEFQPWLYNPFSPFGLVVDEWASEPVLPDHPYNLIRNGHVYDVPWIASQTDFEGMYPASDFLQEEHYLDHIDAHWDEVLPFILHYNYTVDPKLRSQISEKIRKHYLGNRRIDKSSFVDFVRILSHRLFDLDIQKAAKLQASAVKSPIYCYLFKYVGAHSWYEFQTRRYQDFGAAHAEDTAYILNYATADTASTQEDKLMIKFFLDMLTSYAETGVPKTSVYWKAIPKNVDQEIPVLQIDSPSRISMETLVTKDKKFWESLPIKENEKLFSDAAKDEL